MSVKEKRKLFLITLFLFTLFGFGFKWMLTELGWISGIPSRSAEPTSTVRQVPVTQQDLTRAKEVIHQFFPLYINGHKEELKTISTEKLSFLLQEEMDNPLKKNEAKLDKVERVECSAGSGGIHCYVTLRASETEESNMRMVERTYELTLLLEGTRWLVDGVNVCGSFE